MSSVKSDYVEEFRTVHPAYTCFVQWLCAFPSKWLLQTKAVTENGINGCLKQMYSVSQKKIPPPKGPDIFSFFSQTVENL